MATIARVITITVEGTHCRAEYTGSANTAGGYGELTAKLSFDASWQGLTVGVVFRAGRISETVLPELTTEADGTRTGTCLVPAAVQHYCAAGQLLKVGAIGLDPTQRRRRVTPMVSADGNRPLRQGCMIDPFAEPGIRSSGFLERLEELLHRLEEAERAPGGVFCVTYEITPYAETLAAFNGGKLCFCYHRGSLYLLVCADGELEFCSILGDCALTLVQYADGSWEESEPLELATAYNLQLLENRVKALEQRLPA